MDKKENEYKAYVHDDLLELKVVNERLRMAEQELIAAEIHALPLLAFADDAIIVANARAEIIWWNTAAQTMFGYDHDGIQGSSIHILIPEHLKDKHQEAFARVIATGHSELAEKNMVLETEGRRKSGEIFPISLSLTTWVSNKERFFGTIIRKRKKE